MLNSFTLPRIALLGLLLGSGACNRSGSPDADAPDSPAPAASATASALVGQWRNVDGTWRFQANGTFWFMGGTTIHANRTYIDVPRTESLQGTYQVRGTNLHFTLKYPPPAEKISPFQIDGQKLTIDGKVYDRL